jgi:opacity protein-like surface antigen
MKNSARIAILILIFLGMSSTGLLAEGHSAAIKIGYHHFLFPGEDTRPDGDGVLEDGEFDGSIDTASFNGWTFEGEYDYRFHPVFSLACSLQWYGGTSKWVGHADQATVRGDMMMSFTGFLVTPKLHLPVGPVDLHTGAGVGVYWLLQDFTFKIEEPDQAYNQTISDSRSRLGYHLQIGFEYKIRDWVGVLIEDRFAFVRFYGSDPTTNFDELDAGGNSFFLGTRFSF